MKLLLTSSGISSASIRNALVDLLGKPIEECDALFIPTAIYPHPGGPKYAWQAAAVGRPKVPLSELGWKSLGLLELTALPSIDKEIWMADLQSADALLVWGGNVLYLAYWMQQSGVTQLLPSLLNKLVYVGVSAGSMVTSKLLGETYSQQPGGAHSALTVEEMIFQTPQGEINKLFFTAHGAGLVDFAIIPHFENENFPDATASNAEKWAAKLPVPVYAIDDQTAIKVVDGEVEVISEGKWKLFMPKI